MDETPSKPPMAAMDITMSDTGEVTDVDEGMLHR
jgi:hypothetical protein